MKAYKITVVVVDHERMGGDAIADEVARSKYIHADVIDVKEADIGEWSDDHPLNRRDKIPGEVARLFGE